MIPVKLCTNCKWHWALTDTERSGNYDKCKEPEVRRNYRTARFQESPELVDGIERLDSFPFCSIERHHGTCGPLGAKWEPKE